MGDKSRHKHWYVYLYGHPLSPKSYQMIRSTPGCINGRNLCAIYADGYEDQPFEFTNKLKMQIAAALSMGTSQPPDPETAVVLLKN